MKGLLAGKTGLVTGASAGLGRVIAVKAAAEGATVLACARTLDALEQTVAMAAQYSGKVVAHRLDVTREVDVAATVQRVDAELGGIDFSVNCAGIPTGQPREVLWGQLSGALPPGSILTTSEEEYAAVDAVNARGTLWVCKHVIALMMQRQRGGSIANIGSLASLGGLSHWVSYSMAKHAVLGLTRALAADRRYARAGIRCNCICPSFISAAEGLASPFETTGDSDGPLAKLKGLHPAGRLVSPEEVANLVNFLCSDQAPFLNGLALPVEGGLTASLWPE